MTEMDVREFLNGFQAEELAGKGILNGGTRLLNNGSVEPLITLMSERGVSRLEAPERGWSLAATREFQNPRSTEEKSGQAGCAAQSRQRVQRTKHIDQPALCGPATT